MTWFKESVPLPSVSGGLKEYIEPYRWIGECLLGRRQNEVQRLAPTGRTKKLRCRINSIGVTSWRQTVSVSLQNRPFNWLEGVHLTESFWLQNIWKSWQWLSWGSRSSQTASRQWQPKMAVLVAAFLVSVDLLHDYPRALLIAWPKLSQSCTAVWGYLYLIFFSHAPFTDIRPALQCADLPSLHLLPLSFIFLRHLSTFFFFLVLFTWSLCFPSKRKQLTQ